MSRTGTICLAIASLAVGTIALVTLSWAYGPTTAPAPQMVVSADIPILTPRVLLAAPGQPVIVRNSTSRSLILATTPHSPARVRLLILPDSSARLTLRQPGLYHLYDAATAYVSAYQAGDDVMRTRRGAANPNLPDQGWIMVTGTAGSPLDASITIPAHIDLFMPRVAVVQLGGTVTIHNHDSDPHNLVTDPADPTGIAFELFGTNDEQGIGGATRRLTFSEPGLYHIYCSMHTRMVGSAGQWRVVVPRDAQASGYLEHNPMEAWILVIQGQTP